MKRTSRQSGTERCVTPKTLIAPDAFLPKSRYQIVRQWQAQYYYFFFFTDTRKFERTGYARYMNHVHSRVTRQDSTPTTRRMNRNGVHVA